jgi:hypothetical protein
MRSFVRWSSSENAISISRILRSMLRRGDKYRFFASCCVIVLPPTASRPSPRSFSAASSTAVQSTPSCV